MISTWRNSALTPTRSDKMALTLQHNSSPETAALGSLLTAELNREGFNLVPLEQADYLMSCTVEDELVDQGRAITMITPGSAPQTTAQIAGPASAASQPTIPGTMVSKPVVYRNRGIRLLLFSNPQTHPGGIQIVWQGYIAASGSASAKRETTLIKTLLGYLGQEYHGPVNLAQ